MRPDRLRRFGARVTGLPGAATALILAAGLLTPLAGQTSFDWLGGAAHPRGMGLANATVAVADAVEALGMNPAGLRLNGSRRSLQAGLRWYPAGINQKMTQLVIPGERYVFGIELRTVNYGSFPGYDAQGQSQASYTAADFLIRGGLTRRIGAVLYVGGSAGVLLGSLADVQAAALVWSVGAQLELAALGARVGAVVQNRGRFLNEYVGAAGTDELPSAWLVGFSKSLAHLPLTLYLSGGRNLATRLPLLRLAGEFRLPWSLALRLGVDQEKLNYARGQASADLLAGLSVGLGTRTAADAGVSSPGRQGRGFTIDAAVKQMGPLGLSTSVAVGLRF